MCPLSAWSGINKLPFGRGEKGQEIQGVNKLKITQFDGARRPPVLHHGVECKGSNLFFPKLLNLGGWSGRSLRNTVFLLLCYCFFLMPRLRQ